MRKIVKQKLVFLALVCVANIWAVKADVTAKSRPFEGNIRWAVSSNFDKLTGMLNKLGESGLVETDGINEVFSSTLSGDIEMLIKVKGNKVIHFYSTDGTTVCADCDKGEIWMAYPFAKAVYKQTLAEYKEAMSVIKFDHKIFPDSIRKIGGYQCKKAIFTGKYDGVETNNFEYWYTDELSLPKCYLEIFSRPGFTLLENSKTLDSAYYILTTEIEESKVHDANFVIPKGYEIFTPKTQEQFGKKLNDGAKNKKSYTVGSKIPDVFWDF